MTVSRSRTVELIVLVVLAAIILFPVIGVLGQALSPRAGSPAFGDTLSRVWNVGGFSSALTNSFVVAGATTLITTGAAVLAGYAFGAMRFAGSTVLFYVLLVGLIVPLEGYLVPLYHQLRNLGLLDSYPGLVLPLSAQLIPFAAFWMRARFRAMPLDVIEAARVDGAGTWTIFRHVVLPLGRPAILALAVLMFLWSWNDFLLSLVVISSPDLRTAPLQLGLFVGQRTTDIPALASGALIISLPVVLVYVLLQRQLIQGVVSGATRG